jgi:FkbH-like protein
MSQGKNKRSISQFINQYRSLIKESDSADNKKPVKVAILSSFTANGIKETLYVKCHEIGIFADIYICPYNQYAEDIFTDDSPLYRFQPDLIIVFIDVIRIQGDRYLLANAEKNMDNRLWATDKTEELSGLIEKMKENSKAKIIFHNLSVPINSPMGILEIKQDCGLFESVELINSNLREKYKKDPQVFIFDYNTLSSRLGKEQIFDYQLYYLGDIKVNTENIPDLCDEYLPYILTFASQTRKCIVLDLDNTLWGGIIGEDGIDGINLGLSPEGRPFVEFQKYLLSLYYRGIILAINSKNNFDDAMKVIRVHPDMVLRENHFAAFRINWVDKITNLQSLVNELNIGLDSVVFIDDDKLNCMMIRSALPEVLVVELPEDPSLYLQTLMNLKVFDTFQITEEDQKKGQMYVEQRQRTDFLKNASTINEYLTGLNMVVTIESANEFTIPRISQLCQKTNQFNMTTKRYLEENIRAFVQDPEYLVVGINVKDKFGDNGLSGAAIVKKEGRIWTIDTFLLSCRVIGRKIEEALIGTILMQAKKGGAKELIGVFIPTKKNAPAQDFYSKNGFSHLATIDGKEQWAFDISREFHIPDFIKIIMR